MSEHDIDVPGLSEPVDAARAYLAALGAVLVALVGGSLLFPKRVYAGFIWKYFWGPVYADAHGAQCAVLQGGTGPVELVETKAACAGTPYGGIVGYNLYNEIGYALTLVFAVVGVVMLLRRLEVGDGRNLFYGLLPFMFFGGALRVLDDASNAALREGLEPALTYPANTLIISPIIYFTVFALALGSLLSAIALERRDVVDSYRTALVGIGSALLAVPLLLLLSRAFTTDYVHFLPQFTVVVVLLASLTTWLVWQGIEAYAPDLNAGTGRMGAVVVWGHAIDGVANVVGLDWGAELGYPGGDLVGKHPVNRTIVDVTSAVQPQALTDLVGVAWPFLLVKMAVVVFVLSIFDESVFEDSPRYAYLMLVAILAVGLGPGTRDMLRATFGV